MKRFVPLSALLVASALAWGASNDDMFGKFDHAVHEASLTKAKVACVDCHQVGAARAGATDAELAATLLAPPRNACHECHAPGEGGLGSGGGVGRAPHTCATCHDPLPRPDSHVAGWLDHHGPEAASAGASCQDCHSRSTCVDCHDRRENTRWKVHDASWLTAHGIVARADPSGCDSCHVKSECTSCHASSAGFGRSR